VLADVFEAPWRKPVIRRALCLLVLSALGCADDPSRAELVWGRRGVQNGDLVRPRAVAIDAQDRLYIVDFTARIQVYDRDGRYLGPTWTTPDYRNGRPSGLSIDRAGRLIVSDSHYHCFRIYSPDGAEVHLPFGGEGGTALGQLGYVSDVVQDEEGYYYVAEFGENQRITKLDAGGKFVCCWGSAGTEPGQFSRARALALGPDGHLYVADACNDRIQVFTRDGRLVRFWGKSGSEPGKLKYPYDLAFNKEGVLYVVENGNNRVQKFTAEGESLGCWGGPGRAPGQLHNPWALAIDSRGRIHVIDTENHRVQRIAF
jgi:DNA-binding beta-propeller fold protein YncE